MRTRFQGSQESSRPIASQLGLEQLEDRSLPSIAIQISYAYDTSGFFKNNPSAEATLQLAANELASSINTSLAAITPSATNTWEESFYNPANGQVVTVNNPSIAANTIVVYAGARSLGSSQASEGAFGGYGISGTQAWVNQLEARSPGWGTLLWGGSVVFDTGTNWYFGTSASGIAANQESFLTCATHELAHVLGIGTSATWFSQVSTNSTFTGSHAEAIYGGPVPVTWGNSELNDVSVKGVPAVMDLDLPLGTVTAPFTPLDWALLQDVGWSVTMPPPPAPPSPPPPLTPPPVVVSPPTTTTTAPVLVSGANGMVYVYTANASGTLTATGQSFDPFPAYSGTVRTIVGDFDGASSNEYAFVTGAGTTARIRIINGTTGANILPLTQILGGFINGSFVAAGDFSGNGIDDLVIGEAFGGQPLVQVFQISDNQLHLVTSFLAFGSSMTSGVRVAAGDLTKDGIDDLVVGAGPGSAPWVEIYNGAALAQGHAVLLTPAFLAFPSTVTAGVNVAVGNISTDGYADLIVSQDAGGSSLVEIWDGATIVANPATAVSSLPTYVEFNANGSLNTGIRVATEKVNGATQLITAPASGSLAWVRTLTVTSSTVTPADAVFPFSTESVLGGIFLG